MPRAFHQSVMCNVRFQRRVSCENAPLQPCKRNVAGLSRFASAYQGVVCTWKSKWPAITDLVMIAARSACPLIFSLPYPRENDLRLRLLAWSRHSLDQILFRMSRNFCLKSPVKLRTVCSLSCRNYSPQRILLLDDSFTSDYVHQLQLRRTVFSVK